MDIEYLVKDTHKLLFKSEISMAVDYGYLRQILRCRRDPVQHFHKVILDAYENGKPHNLTRVIVSRAFVDLKEIWNRISFKSKNALETTTRVRLCGLPFSYASRITLWKCCTGSRRHLKICLRWRSFLDKFDKFLQDSCFNLFRFLVFHYLKYVYQITPKVFKLTYGFFGLGYSSSTRGRDDKSTYICGSSSNRRRSNYEGINLLQRVIERLEISEGKTSEMLEMESILEANRSNSISEGQTSESALMAKQVAINVKWRPAILQRSS
ncbi:hypothetical protein LXL04_018637 [Taraxacum kok-saghyz]